MVVYGYHFKRISILIFHTNIPLMSHKIITAENSQKDLETSSKGKSNNPKLIKGRNENRHLFSS